MAWTAASSTTWSGSSKTAGTTVSTSTARTVAVGDVLVVIIGANNVGTADGDNSEVSSVTDNLGNTYLKAGEFTNAQGSAAAGATCSIWYSQITTAGNATATATFANSIAAKVITGAKFTASAGATISVVGLATLANDNADPGSMSISGLASQEYLFIRGFASETTVNTPTVTSGYSNIDAIGTSGGGAATNMSAAGESRITTGTGSTSDPTYTNADTASVFVALKEAASSTPISGSDTLTPSLTETSAVLSALARVDTLTPSLTESAALFGAAARTDTLTPSLTEVSALLSSLALVDTLTPSLGESSALLVILAGSDALTPSLTEAAIVLAVSPNVPGGGFGGQSFGEAPFGGLPATSELVILVGSDTLTPSLAEASSLMALLGRVDTLTPALAEAAALSALLARTDTLTPALTEAAALLAALARTDAMTPALAESAALLGLLGRSDALTPALTEASQVAAVLARADTLTPALVEAAALAVTLASADTLTPALAESALVVAALAASDTLTPSLAEAQAMMLLLAATDTLTPSLVDAAWLDLGGFALRQVTVRLRLADGTPPVGARVLAWRLRVGGALRTVIAPVVSVALTDAQGVAVLALLPGFGDAYRVTATAADGTPLLDVVVRLGTADAELHELPRVEDLAWH